MDEQIRLLARGHSKRIEVLADLLNRNLSSATISKLLGFHEDEIMELQKAMSKDDGHRMAGLHPELIGKTAYLKMEDPEYKIKQLIATDSKYYAEFDHTDGSKGEYTMPVMMWALVEYHSGNTGIEGVVFFEKGSPILAMEVPHFGHTYTTEERPS